MASSTFACSPGVTILHSQDLINWETIGGAFADLSLLDPEFNWDRMNDPLCALMAGKADVLGEDRLCEADKGKALAADSTLNRMELGALGGDGRYKKILAAKSCVNNAG